MAIPSSFRPVFRGPFLLLAAAFLLVSCQSLRDEFGLPEEDAAYLEVFLEGQPYSPNADTATLVLPVSGSEIQVFARPVMASSEFVGVEIVEVTHGYALRFTATNRGRHALMRTTGANPGYRLVFVVNNEPIGARRIDGMLGDGVLYTFVEVPTEDLPELVRKLNRTFGYVQKNKF